MEAECDNVIAVVEACGARPSGEISLTKRPIRIQPSFPPFGNGHNCRTAAEKRAPRPPLDPLILQNHVAPQYRAAGKLRRALLRHIIYLCAELNTQTEHHIQRKGMWILVSKTLAKLALGIHSPALDSSAIAEECTCVHAIGTICRL